MPKDLFFYNSLTRELEKFQPIQTGKVGMYSCGPTVYDFAHIGNFRAYVFSDLIHRVLRYFGHDVHLVMNITDVDDKTIRGAGQKGVSLADFNAPFEKAFHEDLRTLGILPAREYPKATGHVPEMIAMIETLLKGGHAYEADGSIYFRLASFPEYGRLMNLKSEDLLSKASGRMKSDEYEKEQLSDFVLWKAYEPSDGAVVWDSPFGKGRPGWHIECSAMSTKYLGAHFDLHTGGMDNKFPHHENEIAQSECCSGEKFVNVWLHCSHLLVDNKKMSKSLGNFYTLRDLLGKGFGPKAIRHLLISTHYRNFLNFTLEGIEGSARAIERVNLFLKDLRTKAESKETSGTTDSEIKTALEKKKDAFESALADDLNVSGALGSLFELMNDIRPKLPGLSSSAAKSALDFFKGANEVFAVFDVSGEGSRQAHSAPVPEEVAALVEERKKARVGRNFSESDRLRDLLKEKGWLVKDGKEGQTIEKL